MQYWIRNDLFRNRIRIYLTSQPLRIKILPFPNLPVPLKSLRIRIHNTNKLRFPRRKIIKKEGGFVSQKWNFVLFSFLAAWSRDSEQAAKSAHRQGKPSSQHSMYFRLLNSSLSFLI
jgi:hypothetical protein